MKNSSKKKLNWSDHYTKKAKIDKYPARSVYKLAEIQKKYCILKKKDRVLDLGCAPGSWLLYAAKIVGSKGTVVGIDLKPISISLPKNVHTFKGNIQNFETLITKYTNRKFNAIISDVAPSTTGNRIVDTTRSLDLCNKTLEIADQILINRGSFICKIFHSKELKIFSGFIKKRFNKHFLFKPQSSRKASKEIYVVGLDKLQEKL